VVRVGLVLRLKVGLIRR